MSKAFLGKRAQGALLVSCILYIYNLVFYATPIFAKKKMERRKERKKRKKREKVRKERNKKKGAVGRNYSQKPQLVEVEFNSGDSIVGTVYLVRPAELERVEISKVYRV